MPTKRMTKGASSRRGVPSRTSAATTGKASRIDPARKKRTRKTRSATDWNKLRRLTGAQIRKAIASDPDAQATDAAFCKEANIVMPAPKTVVTMRLDADLLRWFRQQRGYQTRINAILRAYMQAQL
jgi:uncharacterized protein (DUF4415 family)